MKKLLFASFAVITLMSGCKSTVTETTTYKVNEPVFMSEKEFRESVKVSTRSVAVSDYGKICFYDGYIYISATGKGIHIIDNNNPSNPQNIGFIELLGNADLAIRNGKLYADAFIDLVWFDISNPASPELKGRLENVFPQYMPCPPTGNDYVINLDKCYDERGNIKGIIVGWEVREHTDDYSYTTGGIHWGLGIKEPLDMKSQNRPNGGIMLDPSFPAPNGSSGKNGSMSRFALYKDYLYTVIDNNMSVIDLHGEEPKKAAENIYIGYDVETIFSYKDNMFMGTPVGMVIYSVANPLKPEFMRAIFHIFGCDPVVVEDDIAYVTIHSGNACGQTNNDLMIYDVKDVRDPKHIVTYAMKNPKGLGIDNGTLFLCDDGLKIFDASNPQTLLANRLAHYSGMEGYDVIPFDNVLMMIAEDGLYQYDYSDLSKIKQLSKFPIIRK